MIGSGWTVEPRDTTTGKKLAIVLGTRNRLDTLKRCLGALLHGVHTDHEIIVVDAGSTDGTLEYLHNLNGIHVICDGELTGQAQSLNRVFGTLQTEYVCWLSDDNVVQDRAVDLAVEILDQENDIGMVALKTKDVTGHAKDEPYIGGIWSSGVLNCNQGLLRTALLQKLRGFDEQFRDYGIDADLTTQVLLAGYRVVFTKMVAIHHYRNTNDGAWIEAEGRRARGELAKAWYKNKYKDLPAFPHGTWEKIRWEFRAKSLFLVEGLHRVARTAGMLPQLESLLGYNLRDFKNLFRGRFIACWDFLQNRRKPYYLGQRIPDNLRTRIRFCTRLGERA